MTRTKIQYLLAIALLCEQQEVRMTDVSRLLKVTKPSVHRMLGELSELELVHYQPRGKITLTEKGQAAARRYTAQRSALTRWLKRELAIDEAQADEGALALMACLPEDCFQKISV